MMMEMAKSAWDKNGFAQVENQSIDKNFGTLQVQIILQIICKSTTTVHYLG